MKTFGRSLFSTKIYPNVNIEKVKNRANSKKTLFSQSRF
jgi:hypothetical protein